MIVRHQAGSKRAAIVIFACAVAWVMGVRTPRAASFETIQIAGNGRATLTIDEVGAAPVGTSEAEDDRFGHLEVFAKMTYGSEISVFGRGLYIRSTFTVPRTGDTAVLVVDVDRQGDAKRWEAKDRGLRARLYTIPKSGGLRFDGTPVSGTLELEASVVGRNQAAFRMTGWIEFVDAGEDGAIDTPDDTTLEVEATLESTPTPEEVKGDPVMPPKQPTGGFCEAPVCWVDDGYYDGYYYGYGCGESEVSYESTDDGCAGDTIEDEPYDGGVGGDGSTGGPGDDDLPPSTVDGGDGCSGETTTDDDGSTSSSGCESSDDGSQGSGCDDGGDPSSSSSGCDDGGDSSSSSGSGCGDSSSSGSGCGDSSSSGSGCGDSSSGCGDTSGSSGCGSGGCEGDTLGRPGDGRLKAGVDIVGLILFGGAIATWLGERRRRDDDEQS